MVDEQRTEVKAMRSQQWFGGDDVNAFAHRAWLRSQGYTDLEFDGRPVVGIANSWSEATPCNAHLRDIADRVKRGVWQAGGFPIEFPVMSLGEALMKPTTMLYRNLVALEVEESVRAHPFDSIVTLSGCDKTTVAMALGIASATTPAIMFTGGPMLKGIRGTKEWAGATGLWEADVAHRSGEMDDSLWKELESCVTRSPGHCGVMGTASTMASMVEALGMTLPGCASIPAVDARRLALAVETGRVAVELARSGPTPKEVLTRGAFENAIAVLMATGGSTNAVVHLVALAGRVGVDLTLEDFDRISSKTPVVANVEPVGAFQMEDFFYAGGIPAVMAEISHLLDGDTRTVTGDSVAERIDGVENLDSRVIKAAGEALHPNGGLTVLRGNLCPDGAVIKDSAASDRLLHHRGRAVVFKDKKDLMSRINDPDLDVDADSVLVLQNGGPVGGPGMPEWGMLPIPNKLAKDGVRDMVRISDARMSGTSFGTCVLHISPESAVGGPLGLVRDGDVIELDVPEKTLTLDVPEEELERRRAEWESPNPGYDRGYLWLYTRHVLQADQGVDFDFARGLTESDAEPYDPSTY